MILPSKHLSQDRALLTIGRQLLIRLTQPKTVSALWEEVSNALRAKEGKTVAPRYDAYVLTLDLLFILGAIKFQDGLVSRNSQ